MLYKRIQAFCRERGISIARFEQMCGIGNGTVKRWTIKSPSLRSLIKISRATRVPLEYWLIGVDYEE